MKVSFGAVEAVREEDWALIFSVEDPWLRVGTACFEHPLLERRPVTSGVLWRMATRTRRSSRRCTALRLKAAAEMSRVMSSR